MRKKELEGMSVAELRALAGRLGLKPGAARKAELIESILKGAKKSAASKKPKAKKEAASKPAAAPSPAPEPALVRTGPGLDAPKELMPFIRKRSVPGAAAPPPPPSMFAGRPFEKKTAATAAKRTRPHITRVAPVPQISVAMLPDAPGPAGETGPHAEGVDWIAALALGPTRAFVSWELTEETMHRGTPILRVYDVTGRRFPLEDALRVSDSYIFAGHGSAELGVSPGREYMVDVGVISPEGRFMPARRSGRIFTPPGRPAEGKAVLPERHFRPPGGPGSP